MAPQHPTYGQYGYPAQPPHGYPSGPSRREGFSGLAVSLIAAGALATGCIGGIAVGGAAKTATTSTSAVGPAETVTVTATETVTEHAKAETNKPRETQPAQEATIQEGTWTVGEDIAPGTYKTAQEVNSMCYWQITRSGTNGSDIIKNDIVKGGYPRVTLSNGQDFKSNRCGTWVKIG